MRPVPTVAPVLSDAGSILVSNQGVYPPQPDTAPADGETPTMPTTGGDAQDPAPVLIQFGTDDECAGGGSEQQLSIRAVLVCSTGLACCLPRSLALLAFQTAPAPHALDRFESVWDQCWEAERTFTTFSGGDAQGTRNLYVSTILTDHGITYFALTAGSLAAIWAMSGLGAPDEQRSSSRSRLLIGLVVVLSALQIANCLGHFAIDFLLHQTASFGALGQAYVTYDQFLFITAAHFALSATTVQVVGCCLAWNGARESAAAAPGPTALLVSRSAPVLSRSRFTFSILYTLSVTLALAFCTEGIWGRLYHAVGGGEPGLALVYLAAGKLTLSSNLAVLLLFPAFGGSTLLRLSAMLSFLVEMIMSNRLRHVAFQAADIHPFFSALFASIAISGSAWMVRGLAAVVILRRRAWTASTEEQHEVEIKTLQTMVDTFFGMLIAEEFAQVSSCLVVASQQLLMPVWHQNGDWLSVDEFHRQRPSLAGLLVLLVAFQTGNTAVTFRLWPRLLRLGGGRGGGGAAAAGGGGEQVTAGGELQAAAAAAGEQVTAGGELQAASALAGWVHSSAPVHFRALRWLLCRPLVIFAVSVTAFWSHAFWPKCMMCNAPVSCLLFTRCLRYGEVVLLGEDACKKGFMFTPPKVHDLLRISNISRAELGCELQQLELQHRDCTAPFARGAGGGET